MSANWFIWHAEHKTPLVLIEELNKSYWKVLKPDGETVFVHKSHLTKRMY